MPFSQHYDTIMRSIADEAARCGREAGTLRLIAVSKTVGVEEVGEAIAAGARDFGENRIDSLAPKAEAYPDATWHFIGNIQSRRIREIARYADVVHSLCKESHIERFEEACAEMHKALEILVEVNVSGEESKSGCAPEEAYQLVEKISESPHLLAVGLMTMAPQGDAELARESFEALASLHASIRTQLPLDAALDFSELSMGMSEDWPEAIAAGATMLRIGRALFSDDFAIIEKMS